MHYTNKQLWSMCGDKKQTQSIRNTAGAELMRRTDLSPAARDRSNRECAERSRRGGTV